MSPGCSDIARHRAARVKLGSVPKWWKGTRLHLGGLSARFSCRSEGLAAKKMLQQRLGCEKNVATDEEREMHMQHPENQEQGFCGKAQGMGNILRNDCCCTHGLDAVLYLVGF